MTSIKCGHCSRRHSSAATVQACAQGNLFSCHWIVERYEGWVDEETGQTESWLVNVECGAEAIGTERGWACAAGHEHVNAQTRMNERWDYAEDADEAMGMVRVGVQPFTMNGRIATSPRDFVPSYAMAGVR